MVFICTKCKLPLKTLGLSEYSYLKCSKCNVIIKKNEIGFNLDSNNIKYLQSNQHPEEPHLSRIVFKKILDTLKYNDKNLDLRVLSNFIEAILSSNTIFIAGTGRSKLVAKAFCMRLVHLNLNSFIKDKITSPHITEKDCLIIISKSGEADNELINAKEAKVFGCKILLLTSNSNSEIGKLSNIILNLKEINHTSSHDNSYIDDNYLKIVDNYVIFEILTNVLLDGIIAGLTLKLNKYEFDLKNKHFNLEQ